MIASPPVSSQKNLTRALVVLVAVNIMNFYDRQLPGALAEPIRKEFHLTDTQLGLIGSAFIWLYAIVGVPLGRVADSWSRKKLLAAGLVVWSMLTAFAAFATNFALLLVSRLGVAVGEAVTAPTATSWLGDLFPVAQRSRALALFMLGVPIGGALSFFFSGAMAQAWGWRTAMVVAALPALFLAPALLSLHEPARGASEAHADHVVHSFSSVLRIPTLWWIIASGAFLNFNMYAIGSFLPAFVSRVHGLAVGNSGYVTGISYGLGGVMGGVAAGMWGDHIVHKRKDGRMLSSAIVSLAAAPLAYVGIIQPAGSLVVSLVFMTFAYAALSAYYGLVYSSIQDIVPPASRGRAMAVYFMAMYMCGASLGPLLTGNLSDRMAKRAMLAAGADKMTEAFKAIGLQQAMLVIPVLSVFLAIVLYIGSRTITADMARREAAAAAARAS